jgi:ATP phosphoribosyltransferase regulatory subunit HisZ
LPLPTRLFYVQNVFRFSVDGDREDWQCGIEYLGAPPVIGDVEVAALACETLDALGLSPSVRLGHVGVPRAVAAALRESGAGELRAMLDAVANGGLGALRPAATAVPQLAAFIDVALQPAAGPALVGNLAALASSALPGVQPALDELAAITAALVSAGRPVLIDFSIPRDFEYYTGVVFEFDAGGEAWGRGGRYAPGGADTAATACGLGLEAGRLAEHVAASTAPTATVAIVPATPDDLGAALAAARALHRSGIAGALALDERDASVAVRVAGGQFVAHTPSGTRTLNALGELVELLVQYK